MKKIIHYIVISFVLIISLQTIQAQSKLIKKGDSFYKKGEYYRALESYNLAKDAGDEFTINTKKRVANCHFHLNDIQNAFETFIEVQDDLSGEDLLTYALVNHKFGAYDLAIEWYEKAKEEGGNPVKINELIESCKWARENDIFVDYRVNPTTIFTFGQSFGIQFYKDGVVYSSSSGDNDKNVDKQGKSFLNLYYSDIVDNEIQPGRLLSKKLVFPYHIGAISFTSDFNTMYYTRSVRVKGGLSKLKIYKVTHDGNDWGGETELTINSDEFDCATPAVSPDDRYLYFVSNRPGGYGGKDIYKVERLRGGLYGKVQNVGPEINTFGNEEFPFISKYNVLYFSSDGHYGFGGLDLFKAESVSGKWKNVQNLLKPFNSEKDDFAYVVNPQDPRRGFLSSSRTGSGDQDAIFYVEFIGEEEKLEAEPKPGDVIILEELPEEPVKEPVKEEVKEAVKEIEKEEVVEIVIEKVEVKEDLSIYPSLLTTKVKSTFNNVPASGIKVEIIDDASGNIIASGYSDAKGNINITIPDKYRKEGQEFELVYSKEGEFNSKRMIVNIMEINDINDNGLSLTPIFNDNVLDEINNMVLYYKGEELTEESKVVLSRLATYLQRNPQLVVKLNTHTEARGNRFNNLNASQQMGEKVEKLLMEKGVSGDATIPRGYGDRYLINKCKRGVFCSEEEQLKNRRIEVVVWKVKE
jgi:outer membrane protein OmpA-like peptidoglycan-associated protein